MNVLLLDLQAQYLSLRDDLREAVERVMGSQRFVLSDEVRELENTLAAYCETKHAVGCASGSDALLLALMALAVKTGDEVITTPFSFFATAACVARLGARPVFVDIDPATYNLDTSRVADAITPRTKVIMPVHLYGQCAPMDPLLELGKRRGIPIIEDAAQAIGATDNGRRAGSMGAIGCFSFYPTKNLAALVTAASSPRTTTISQLVCGDCAITAAQPSTSTRKSESTAVWMNCRQRCCASNFPTLIAGQTNVRAKPTSIQSC